MRIIWESVLDDVQCAVDKIYDRMFTRYISPSEYDKLTEKGYFFKESKKDIVLNKAEIINLLCDKKFVTAGWTATDISNYHRFYIIYKD